MSASPSSPSSPSNPSSPPRPSPYGPRQPHWEFRAEETIPFWLRAGICIGFAIYLAYALTHTALD